MSTLLLAVLALTLICAIVPEQAAAQKEWMNRYGTLMTGDDTNPSVATPSQASFAITVFEHHNPNTGKDIYIQKVDRTTGVTLWNPDGIPLCMEANDQRNPRAAYDSLGGVIITWEDCRGDDENVHSEIYAVRVNVQTGDVTQGWTQGGEPVARPGTKSVTCLRPRIAGTADGAYITWFDDRRSSPDRDIYAQYVSWDGQMNWKQDGIQVAIAADPDQINPEISRDYLWDNSSPGRCGAVIAFLDNRNQSKTTNLPIWNVYVQRVDPAGNALSNDIRVADVDEEQINQSIVASGRDATNAGPRAIICWQDARDDPQTSMYDIYAQVLDEGNVRMNTTGLEICTVPDVTQIDPVMTLWERPFVLNEQDYAPFVFIAWRDGRDSHPNVFGCLMDAYGGCGGSYPWLAQPDQPEGTPIASYPNVDKSQCSIDNIGAELSAKVLVAWRQDLADGDIFYQGIDIQSFEQTYIPAWSLWHSLYGKRLTEAKGEQCLPQVSGDMFVWQDARRQQIANDTQSDWNIFCESLGQCTDPKEYSWRATFARWWGGSDARHMRFVTDPSDYSIYMVWDEVRNGAQSAFVQKFDKDGVPRWTNNGVMVNPAGESGEAPDVAIDRAGGAQVVYKKNALGPSPIGYVHVNAAGVPITRIEIADPGDPNAILFDPVCVENFVNPTDPAGPGILVACLKQEVAGISRKQGWASLAGGKNLQPIQDVNLLDHTMLKIEKDNIGGCYLMTNGIRNGMTAINVTWCEQTIQGTYATTPNDHQNETIAGTAFGGYDMAADVFDPVVAGPRQLNVVYSLDLGGGYRYLFADRFDGLFMTPAARYNPVSLQVPGIEEIQPALTSNHYLYQQLPDNQYDGPVIAWDASYEVTPGVFRHDVKTTTGYWWVPNSLIWPPLLYTMPEILLAQDLPSATFPAISHSKNAGLYQAPEAYVAWQGFTEECSPPRQSEIVSAYVSYSAIPPATPGNQWGTPTFQTNMRIDPGSGPYSELRPMLRKSGEDAAVFWYDTRTGVESIVGTTVYDFGGFIEWRKPEDRGTLPKQTAAMELGQNYPNPVHGASADPVTFRFTLPRDAYATLVLYDAFGREVATLHEGYTAAGSHTVQFRPGDHGIDLVPGAYVYALSVEGRRIARTFIVVH